MLLQKCKIQADLSLAKNWNFDHECNRGNGAALLMAKVLYLIAAASIHLVCVAYCVSVSLKE